MNKNPQIQLIKNGGEAGELINSKNWSATALGAMENWPQSLITALNIIVNSKFPMLVFWGPQLLCFYNDAYRPSLGSTGKHPSAIGKPAKEVWPERWHLVKPFIDEVINSGKATWEEDKLVTTYRNGQPEDVYWTFSYSPVINEQGEIGGVFVTANETTQKIQSIKKLKESEKYILRIITDAPVAMCILKTELYVVEIANERMLQLWGKTAEEVLNKPFFEGRPEARGQGLETLLDNVFITGENYEAKEKLLRLPRNGKTENIYVNFVYEALRQGDGTVTGILAVATDVTEQVKARKKIEASEERLNIALESSQMGVWEIDFRKGLYTRSLRHDQIMGYETIQTEWNFNIFLQHIIDKDKPVALDALEQSEKTGKENFEVRIVRAGDKEIRWIRISGERKYDENKVALRMLGTITDITEQKRSQQLLKESEQRQSLALDTAQMGFFDLDIITDKAVASLKHFQVYGYNEILPEWGLKDFLQHVIEQDKPLVAAAFDSSKKTGRYYVEARILREDDEIRWVKIDGKMFLKNETPIRLLATISDITQNKKAEQLLIESEKRFRLIADNAPVMIWMTNANFVNSFFNKSWLDFTGIPLEEQLGNSNSAAIHPDDHASVTAAHLYYFSRKEKFTLEMRLKRYDGMYRWISSTGIPRYTEDGVFEGYTGAATDINDIKEHEQRKDDFIRMASHELKTPITSIKGFVQLLLKTHSDTKDPLLNTSLITIDRQIVKLTKLIYDLLDLTKLEAGRLQMNRENFSLNSLIKDTVEDIRHTTEIHKIIFKEQTHKSIYADKERIAQVLTNYLTNAIKYSPDANEVIVTLSSTENEVIVSVQDFGIGIEEQDRSKIFERFYRVQGKNEQTYPGFGIGLYIANEIIQNHHGKLWVESEKDKGSVFYFSLPAHTHVTE